ncbi:MAG: hypothetical protein HUJ29_02205 [Gammaproteobacteria bacterium]|nr:hypothetical protein [Gammaproteobacteria bacterium]
MKVGGSAGSQAAQQLMQATNQVAQMSTRQLQAVNNNLNEAKAGALQQTAQMQSSAADRKSQQIDVIA